MGRGPMGNHACADEGEMMRPPSFSMACLDSPVGGAEHAPVAKAVRARRMADARTLNGLRRTKGSRFSRGVIRVSDRATQKWTLLCSSPVHETPSSVFDLTQGTVVKTTR